MQYLDTPKKNALGPSIPQYSHDPNIIAFRSWTTILSLDGALPDEIPADSSVLFLDEKAKGNETERLPVRGSVCLRNPTRFAHLNVTIICAASGRKVFFVQELPAGRFLYLEFLQQGSYTLHYYPAFSLTPLRRQIKTFIPMPAKRAVPRNFKSCLKPAWFG